MLSLCLSGTPQKIDRICELFVYVKPFFLRVRNLCDSIFAAKCRHVLKRTKNSH